ncbi:MAG: PASTA domain-containing protein [Bacteroidales bacterium]|nr:PASTA domain-containing protein [Bacteroidales bacterium]
MNKLITYISGKEFLKNLLLAIGIILFLLIALTLWLKVYTHHGRFISVPDLTDLPVEDASKIINERKLRYEIFDSIFIITKEKGVVVDQHPRPGFLVKKNRKIYLTINANQPEKIVMPELVGVTLREARLKMEVSGLIIGKLSYQYDMAKNVVLEQMMNGQPVEIGDTISKGSRIDLVLGKGLSNEKAMVPNLIGLSEEEAVIKASDAFFSIGTAIPDQSIEENTSDSLIPRVFRQHPVHRNDVRVPLGTQITLWVTVDSMKFAGTESSDSADYGWQELNEVENIEHVEEDSYDYDYNE